MWKIVQISTFLAVYYSAIHDGWGDGVSGLAIGVVAGFAAFLVTAIPFAIADLWIRARVRIYGYPKRGAVLGRRQ